MSLILNTVVAATKTKIRQPVGNGNLAPYTYTTTTSRSRTYLKKRYVAGDANRSKIRLHYSNFTAGGQNEATNYPDLVIRSGIATVYGGSITAATFDKGVAEKWLPAGTIEAATDDIALTLNAGSAFFEIVETRLPLLCKSTTVLFNIGETVTGAGGATGVIKAQKGYINGTTGTGTLLAGETVTGGTSGKSAVIDYIVSQSGNAPNKTCTVFLTTAKIFTAGEVITGGTSGATYTIGSFGSALTITGETGTFVADEAVTDPRGGAALVDFATSNIFPYTVSGHNFNLEGALATNSKAGGSALSFVTNPPVLTPTIVNGNITGVSGTGGSGYTSAPSLIAFEWSANQMFVKTLGYCTVSGGATTGNYPNSNWATDGTPPAGLAAWVNPTVIPVGGGGFGQNTALYCASLVSGIPATAVNSINVIGDSISRGDSAADGTGDPYVNHGIERMVANAIAVINMSRSSAKASYDAQYATIYPRLYALYMGRTTHALITLGSNDISALDSYNTLASNINTIKSYVESFGTLCSEGTIIPRVSGTYATEGGQTPVSGFAAGGVMDTYNAALLAGTILSSFGVYNPYAFFRGVDANKFRVDLGQVTTDGIHPNNLGNGVGGADSALIAFFSKLR